MGKVQSSEESLLVPHADLGASCAPRLATHSSTMRGAERQNVVLYILVHGIHGTTRDWEVWQRVLVSHAPCRPNEQVVIRASEAITSAAAFAGSEIRIIASLLAEEVRGWALELLGKSERPSTTVAAAVDGVSLDSGRCSVSGQTHLKMNFICHSLGGIITRAALPEICGALEGNNVRYGHFLSLNTPHLGIKGANALTAWKNLATLIPQKLFLQIQQLTLQEGGICARRKKRPGWRPLFLEELANPAGRFLVCLSRFEYRTLVGATHWDLLVPFCSAVVTASNPFPKPNILKGEAKEFWRIDAAVGFASNSKFMAGVRVNAGAEATAREFAESVKPPDCDLLPSCPASSSAFSGRRENSPRRGESPRRGSTSNGQWVRAKCKALTTKGGVTFPENMLDGISSVQWRRVAYTLHHPWYASNVHEFSIGKDRKLAAWGEDFIRLMVLMFEDDAGTRD